MNMYLMAASIFCIVVAAYIVWIRPRMMTWGAVREETVRGLPGDGIVRKPHFIATRAVTIGARPSEVWKWIIQIGSARAGWYSIDWMDNGGVHSSDEILPEFQKIDVDYFIPFTPNQKNGMWVKEYREYEYIVWWDRKGNGTWGWYLDQQSDGHTRLITRLRTRYDFSFPWILYYLLYDVGDIVMMRKCMMGIKQRAERKQVLS